MKIISWNVNGIRASLKKNFFQSFELLKADIFGMQETKIQDSQLTDEIKNIKGYESIWSHCKIKKGYSGVGVYSKITPTHTKYGIGIPEYDDEGRIIEIDFQDFIFFNIYFPNGQKDEVRLNYKLNFYKHFFEYADNYQKKGRSLIISGDFNTAHNEIDLKNPKANEKNSGFLRIERDWLDKITQMGFIDAFRYYHPDTVKYSWWSYRFNAREKNIGWRIDYFFVTKDIIDKGWIKELTIENDIYGSDHCPIGIVLNI
ncbi:MAG: exodeoxyribonuclease III [Desulfobacterales bacterium]|nr:exodeoxyribonuclease III [Desulfobacterales bacterium]